MQEPISLLSLSQENAALKKEIEELKKIAQEIRKDLNQHLATKHLTQHELESQLARLR